MPLVPLILVVPVESGVGNAVPIVPEASLIRW